MVGFPNRGLSVPNAPYGSSGRSRNGSSGSQALLTTRKAIPRLTRTPLCQPNQYRTIRPVVAAAPFGTFQQCAAHGFKRCGLTTKVFGLCQGNSLPLTACPLAVVPQAEEIGDQIGRAT